MSLVTPDFGLLFWMTLIFAIVFFVLAKWGFPAITGMVDKRSERINESIEKAREAEKMLSEMSERQAAMLEETRAEQGRILREAAQARDAMVGQAKQQAQDEAAKILDHARTQIAAEKETALKKMGRSAEITRFKGLGEISPDEFKGFIGEDIRLEMVHLTSEDKIADIIQFYMGDNTPVRQKFIRTNLRSDIDNTEEAQ